MTTIITTNSRKFMLDKSAVGIMSHIFRNKEKNSNTFLASFSEKAQKLAKTGG